MEEAVGVAHEPSPRRKVVELAVPVPSLAVPTVPDDKLLAFSDVKFAPDTEPNEPDQVPLVIVPTDVNELDTTLDARVVPDNVLASAVAVGVAHVPSPRKKVEELAVPVPRLLVDTGVDKLNSLPTSVKPVPAV